MGAVTEPGSRSRMLYAASRLSCTCRPATYSHTQEMIQLRYMIYRSRRCTYASTSAALPLAAIALTVLLSACAGAVQADPATVAITSNPSGAKVYVSGYFKGFTPCTVSIGSATSDSRDYRFSVQKPGYERYDVSLSLRAGEHQKLHAQMEKAVALAGRLICIDPGHPSETSPGTKGPAGVTENRMNWVIALKLKQALLDQGARVVMTKSAENEKVTNRRRAEIANSAGADIMVRLHCDAASATGYMLFYPDRAGTVQGVTGPSQQVRTASRAAAEALDRGMTGVLSGHLNRRGVRGDSATAVGARQGALTGSIFSQVPTVTVEMVVLTNRADEKFISSAAGQDLMTRALLQGLMTYFGG